MTNQYMSSAVITLGLTICGISPEKPLTTVEEEPCFNCGGRSIRKFSGSGWYDDFALCVDCGEDTYSGYRPFEPRWRKRNMEKAEKWLVEAVPNDEFWRKVHDLVSEEMGWDD